MAFAPSRNRRKAASAAWRAGICLALSLISPPAPADEAPLRRAVVLEIDGAIGPATSAYVARGIEAARPEDTGLIVLRLDTPGGLDSSMREIIRAILASPVPVAAYVAPSGARAASAGTYIAYAAAIAAMAPGTNLGAATPITIGLAPPAPSGQPGKPPAEGKEKPDPADQSAVEPDSAMHRKMVNDAVAYIRGLAELNGRNADWAAEAVRGAVSLPAAEALKLHVVDVIARDLPDLLQKIDGKTVTVLGRPFRLETAHLAVAPRPPDWRTRFLSVITNPNVAYLLMLLGAFGLIIEVTSPGAVVPGLIGAISLLLALFAFNLLPIDYAGAALILLGIGLMVAEAVIGAFGMIGVGGIAAFAFGSIMAFRGTGPAFGLSIAVVIGATAASAGFLIFALALLLRSRRRPVVTGREALLGAEGETVDWHATEGRVLVQGEVWRARSDTALAPGAPVRVTGRDGLVLAVESKTPAVPREKEGGPP